MFKHFAKVVLSLWILFLVGVQPTCAAPQELSQQDAKFTEWMTHYYIHKDISKVSEFLQWLQTTKILTQHNGPSKPIAAFLSIIFANNKSQLQSWLTKHTFTGKTKETIAYALWLSDNGQLITKLFKETPTYIKSSPINLLSMPLKQPSDLDMMWGAFLASGNDTYVKKVVDVLDERTPLTGDKTLDMATRSSADWSLGSNMMQHELVNRLIHKETTTRRGSVKKTLEAIIAQNKKKTPLFPNRDGDFSAMMVVINKNTLAEFDKPSSQGVKLQEVSKANRGDRMIIKILFSGMELTNELMSNVTFDLKILDPEGDIYGKSDLKELEALKKRIPKRFSVFDNLSFIEIGFGQQDKLGKYQFIATIRDNVGKKSISLKQEVNLVQ
jgi:hypothetical protein